MSPTATPRRTLRPGAPLRATVRLALGIALTAAAATVSATSDSLVYSLEIQDHEAARYVVELPVRHPGTLRVDVEWSGSRTLAFKIEGPGSPAVKTRRAGPSPQRLVAEVTEADLGTDQPWKLHIRSLSDRGEIDGVLTVTLPSAPGTEPEPEVAEAGANLPPQEPWLLPGVAPRGSADSVARVFLTSEGLRAWVVPSDGVPRSDACGWHTDLLRYLAARRDVLRDGRTDVGEATSRFLLRVVNAIRLVEELRSSDDPILAGPMPEQELERRAWLTVRKQHDEPIEDALDTLSSMLRRDFAPQLADETWPQRLVGCLTACERFFEQRTRRGGRAANESLAVEQWDGIMAAAGALEALASVRTDPAVVALEPPLQP